MLKTFLKSKEKMWKLLKDENLEKSIDKIQDLLYENIKNQEKFEGLNEIKLENFKIGL